MLIRLKNRFGYAPRTPAAWFWGSAISRLFSSLLFEQYLWSRFKKKKLHLRKQVSLKLLRGLRIFWSVRLEQHDAGKILPTVYWRLTPVRAKMVVAEGKHSSLYPSQKERSNWAPKAAHGQLKYWFAMRLCIHWCWCEFSRPFVVTVTPQKRDFSLSTLTFP